MHFSYPTVVLAALAFECALAQPSHRHLHQHKPRGLSDVLGKRVDYNDPTIYKNPVTGNEYTPAEWSCLVAKNGDHSCYTVDVGSSDGSPPPATSAPPAAPAATGAPAVSSPAGSAPPASNTGSASSGSDSDSGPGAHIFNKGSGTQTFVFYENDANGAGQSSNPGQSITLTAGSDKFVSLPTSWKGHVQRGQSDPTVISPASWAEFQVQASDGNAWGDISLQKGCDGAVKIISATDPSQAFGFEIDIITGAPEGAKVQTSDGQPALGYTTGGWMGTTLEEPNQAAIDWEQDQVGQSNVYILGGTGTDVIKSSNNVVHVEFY